MISLERRLHIGLASALIILLGLLWFVGHGALRNMTENWIESRLQHDAEGLLAAMMISPGNTKVRWRRMSQVYSQPLSGHYYLVKFDNGELHQSRSLWDESLTIPNLKPGQRQLLHIAGPSNQQLLMLLRGYQKQGRHFTIGVAEDMTPIYAERDRYIQWFAWLAIGSVILLLLVQRWVIRRSMKQLDNVRQEIRQLEQGKTGALSETVPSEVAPLVKEFNQLLALLDQRLERSRNSLGNLAHALKGPLNLLIQYFDKAPNLEKDDPKHQQAMLQTQRIQQLMERELKRARLAGQQRSSQRFNPTEELPDLIAVLGQVHGDHCPSISYRVDQSVAPFGEREDILELLGNLLDNACKWASSQVHCHISSDQGTTVSVEDDGNGVDKELIEQLTRRGTRLDETTEGHGLGLAIARDIVNLYGGSIRFQQSEQLKGLQVIIELPGSESL